MLADSTLNEKGIVITLPTRTGIITGARQAYATWDPKSVDMLPKIRSSMAQEGVAESMSSWRSK